MFWEISPANLFLILIKITAFLLIGFALTAAIKNARLRALTWSGIFACLPLFFLFPQKVQKFPLIPNFQTKHIPEALEDISFSSVELQGEGSSEGAPAIELDAVSTRSPAEPVVEIEASEDSSDPLANFWLPSIHLLYFVGIILSLTPWLLSNFQLYRLKTRPSSGLPREIWRSMMSWAVSNPSGSTIV